MHRGGGNSLKPSHNHGLWHVWIFNNLALWGEKKFVSVLKRTYKFKRGVYCHTEDNSPKYRMVCNDVGLESPTYRSFKFWYRDFGSSLRAIAKQSSLLNRLRNKCAMTDVEENILSLGGESGCLNEVNYNHERGLKHELINNEPSPEFLSSSQLTKKFNPLTAREGNCFTDKVFSRFTSHYSLKSAAFTLAEVLVTLGIIGVVSAMTVPTLMQNYQRQSYVTQLHKVYNEMSQGFQQMMTDRNALNLKETGLLNTTEQATETFKNYLKVVQDCGNNFSPCFASEYHSTTGSSIKTVEANWWSSSFVLADGAAIGLHGLIDYSAGNVNYPYGYMYVDINGAKGPNIAGRDFFLFYYFNDGTLDDVVTPECKTAGICSSTLEVQRVNSTCVGQTWPAGCFGRILNDNWQMTY